MGSALLRLVFASIGVLLTLPLFAQTPPVVPNGSAVPNWTVPPYHGSSGGLTTMSDLTPPRAFVAVAPCRVVDTRNPNGPYGGPPLAANVSRTFDIDNGPCAGLPSGIEAYSLSFGAILPPADGFLTAWPTGTAQPLFSQVNLIAGEVVANAAIVPAGTNGAINVLVNIGPTHVYIDINGYFSDTLGTPGNPFELETNSGGPSAFLFNLSTTCSGPCGLEVVTNSGNAIYGFAEGGDGHGVFGTTNSSGAFAGVLGQAFTASGWGGLFVNGSTGFGAKGVLGQTSSLANNSAGVHGFNGGGEVPGSFTTAGVRGESGFISFGVLGLATAGTGTGGFRIEPISGNVQSGAELGFSSTVGLVVYGDSQITGAKSFIEPHPSDASKMIRYISLEGNEAGTYFRGRGKFQNGVAVIEVPEDFRIVTDPEGLTVQITPIGGMATFGVVRIGLDGIVAQASRDLEFSYLVQGIRHAYKHSGPIAENEKMFVPTSPDEPMPAYLPAVLQQRLISNGTYTADGKVNVDTAQRLGWDKIWEQRSRPAPELTP